MANLPHDLLRLGGHVAETRERIDHLYEKLNGLCRWFGVGINGLLFPSEEGDVPVDATRLLELLGDRSEGESQRIYQFIEEFRKILAEHGASYEGAFELIDPERIAGGVCMVKAAYTLRPFWRWY